MAPEQLRADTMLVSLPADVFSWGMLSLEVSLRNLSSPSAIQNSLTKLLIITAGHRQNTMGERPTRLRRNR